MIFIDTNVISETLRPQPDPMVLQWLLRHDAELALSTVVIAEISFGISKLPRGPKAERLHGGLSAWRRRLAERTFAFTDDAAMDYGEIMAGALRQGRPMSAPDGMIAALALVHRCPLATRNGTDFETSGITLINPWRDL